MTDWTSNRLTVKGEQSDLKDFADRVKGTDGKGSPINLSLSSLVPAPDQSGLNNAPPNCPIDPDAVRQDGERAWRLVKWGTDQEAKEVDVDTGAEAVVFRFLTAGSAPFPWLEEVSGLFPGLVFEFEYQDEGSDEEEQGTYIKCVFRRGEMVEGEDGAWRDLRVVWGFPYVFEDPWLYYFFAHPDQLKDARELMSGAPPEEIRDWIELVGAKQDPARLGQLTEALWDKYLGKA